MFKLTPDTGGTDSIFMKGEMSLGLDWRHSYAFCSLSKSDPDFLMLVLLLWLTELHVMPAAHAAPHSGLCLAET